ncbi:MAG: phosphatidylglycerophosphatase A [Deltaproteobacteria bacterium]|nr:phosphatidylglycerophosphatase A [Deltaproteobacteria bacterium]MBW2611639.1 phosphatidylglycerophosphatase A [Deltaproteobacteria bacterium]MBW2711035.1 phosphatidylglycerophosphatase A [Deltaproteobacteria bacterium]
MKFGQQAVLFFSTGFFTGYLPFAPGTFGTLPALPLCYLLSTRTPGVSAVFILVFIALAVLLAHSSEKMLGKKDPGSIVIDEMAGMMVTLAWLPFNFFTAVAGFVVFRLLDIFKPFPIRYLERKIAGGAGIVIDDVVAGIIANITLRIIIYLLGN